MASQQIAKAISRTLLSNFPNTCGHEADAEDNSLTKDNNNNIPLDDDNDTCLNASASHLLQMKPQPVHKLLIMTPVSLLSMIRGASFTPFRAQFER
jgi:hypothetical protein